MQKYICIIFEIYTTMCFQYVQCIEWQLNFYKSLKNAQKNLTPKLTLAFWVVGHPRLIFRFVTFQPAPFPFQ